MNEINCYKRQCNYQRKYTIGNGMWTNGRYNKNDNNTGTLGTLMDVSGTNTCISVRL